jgi:hypothetical protein
VTIRIVRPVGSGLIAPAPPGPGVYSETISDTVGVVSALTSSVPSGVPTWRGNEPAGLTQRVHADFNWPPIPASADEEISIDGVFGVASNTGGWHTVVDDQDGPQSPPHALQVEYPAGLANGTGPGLLYGFFPANTDRVYMCMSIKFEDGFEWNGISDKLFQLNNDLILQAQHGGDYLNIVYLAYEAYPPNQSVTPTLDDGEYHQIELYNVASTGFTQVWWDGVLVSQYASLPGMVFPRASWGLLSVWGGSGSPKVNTDYRWVDTLYISSST